MYFDEPFMSGKHGSKKVQGTEQQAGNSHLEPQTGRIESKPGAGRGLKTSKLILIIYFSGKVTPPKTPQKAPTINDQMFISMSLWVTFSLIKSYSTSWHP